MGAFPNLGKDGKAWHKSCERREPIHGVGEGPGAHTGHRVKAIFPVPKTKFFKLFKLILINFSRWLPKVRVPSGAILSATWRHLCAKIAIMALLVPKGPVTLILAFLGLEMHNWWQIICNLGC